MGYLINCRERFSRGRATWGSLPISPLPRLGEQLLAQLAAAVPLSVAWCHLPPLTAGSMGTPSREAPLTAANNIQACFCSDVAACAWSASISLSCQCSCSRSLSFIRRRLVRPHPFPPRQLPGLGGESRSPSRHLPTPNLQRDRGMTTMRGKWSCTSSSAWRPSTAPGPRSNPPSMSASLHPIIRSTSLVPHYVYSLMCAMSHLGIASFWFQEVLRGINLKLFDQVLRWVQESFSAIRSITSPCPAEIQQPYPLLTDVICRKIPTAFVLTSKQNAAIKCLTDCFLLARNQLIWLDWISHFCRECRICRWCHDISGSHGSSGV